MDNETKEILVQILKEVKEIKSKVEMLEKNQANVANAEHKNWHMLADKLGQYDQVLYNLFGKKKESK